MASIRKDGTRSDAGAGSVSKRWYTEREISTYAGIPVKTLQGWRCRGQGPPFCKMPTGGVRYDIAAVDTWIQGGGAAA